MNAKQAIEAWSYLPAESRESHHHRDETGNALREYLVRQARRFLPGDAVVLVGEDEVWLFRDDDFGRRCPGFNEVAAAWLERKSAIQWRDMRCGDTVHLPNHVDLLIALHDGTVGTISACVQWEPTLVGVEVTR